MIVVDFIKEFLSQCDDTIICLHSPDGYSRTTFSIHDWNNCCVDSLAESHIVSKVSQIVGRVENYHYNLAVVIHIYTDNGYEEIENEELE